jgi:hypothetical protein
MIRRFVSYELVDSLLGTLNVSESSNGRALIFNYPCESPNQCTPYKLTLSRGEYLFECWGARGGGSGKVGKGAYTSGILSLTRTQNVYVYIGALGLFNAGLRIKISPPSGGATDVRLVYNNTWSDKSSLISRIMVAGGGGAAEWNCSIGGNGGAPNGTESYIARGNYDSAGAFPTPCIGATNTRGGYCTTTYYIDNVYRTYFEGQFGVAGNSYTSNDLGGLGGGGYYGGSTLDYTGGGSGGSSFVSGHPFCNAVEENTTIAHTGEPFHYSGLIFINPNMIEGGKTMPLPNGNMGIHNDVNGTFRLTLLSNNACTKFCKKSNYFPYIFIFIVFSFI